MLGFLSPANRGSMLTVTLLLFVLMGCVAGYSAVRLALTLTLTLTPTPTLAPTLTLTLTLSPTLPTDH